MFLECISASGHKRRTVLLTYSSPLPKAHWDPGNVFYFREVWSVYLSNCPSINLSHCFLNYLSIHLLISFRTLPLPNKQNPPKHLASQPSQGRSFKKSCSQHLLESFGSWFGRKINEAVSTCLHRELIMYVRDEDCSSINVGEMGS